MSNISLPNLFDFKEPIKAEIRKVRPEDKQLYQLVGQQIKGVGELDLKDKIGHYLHVRRWVPISEIMVISYMCLKNY